jgi:amidase
MIQRPGFAILLLLAAPGLVHGQSKRQPFTVVEATIPEMQAALKSKRITSHELVTQYLTRIALYDRTLHALIAVNPKALAEADELDRERAAGKIRGPLHGIPIALKDNIQANGMPTTGGALAFAYLVAPYEATLTKNLRDSGAIIIAKTTLIELANWVAGAPTPMSAYNASPASASTLTIHVATLAKAMMAALC